MTLEQWMRDLKYLPEEFRDFHDQKDLFKAIAPMLAKYQAKSSYPELKQVSWADLQMLTIDVFLWFMAMHGYTLQPIPKRQRERLATRDLSATIAEDRAQETRAFQALLTERLSGSRQG